MTKYVVYQVYTSNRIAEIPVKTNQIIIDYDTGQSYIDIDGERVAMHDGIIKEKIMSALDRNDGEYEIEKIITIN